MEHIFDQVDQRSVRSDDVESADEQFIVIEDGRLAEEQPGVVWNPPGGERVARSAAHVDASDAGLDLQPDVEDETAEGMCQTARLSDAWAVAVSSLVARQFVPGESLRRNLDRSVRYLESEDFLTDLLKQKHKKD